MKKVLWLSMLLVLFSSCRPDCSQCPPATDTVSLKKADEALAMLAKKDDYLDVTIKGLTVFYLRKDPTTKEYIDPMLLIVKDPQGEHKPTIAISDATSAELEAAIGYKDCDSSACPMGNYRIRVTDDGSALSAPFQTSTEFDSDVVQLTEANPKFTDFVTDADDTTEPPKGAILAALDLRGAKVLQVTRFPCTAKFPAGACNPADGSFRRFASRVKIRFGAAKPKLEFLVKKGDVRSVGFSGANPQDMAIHNVSSKPGSHMHLLEQLSKTGVCLPHPIQGSCTGVGTDYVPGCGNTQFP